MCSVTVVASILSDCAQSRHRRRSFLRLSNDPQCLMQALDIVRHRPDLTVGEPSGNAGHRCAVESRAIAKRCQLRSDILGVLPAQTRVLNGYARAIGTVATRTGCTLRSPMPPR